jgi:hypothetical protein
VLPIVLEGADACSGQSAPAAELAPSRTEPAERAVADASGTRSPRQARIVARMLARRSVVRRAAAIGSSLSGIKPEGS